MKKSLILLTSLCLSFLLLEAEPYSFPKNPGPRTWPVILVEFQADNYSYTTGDGLFLTTEWPEDDTSYVVDGLPHDKSYFRAHRKAVNNYWTSVSAGKITVDTAASVLLPESGTAYSLPEQMKYYSSRDSLDYRLARMVYQSVKLAADAGDNLPANDGLIIYHAGVGQDFNISLDDTPFDIPSFYFDEDYLSTYLPAEQYNFLAAQGVEHGIVLPEYQSQLMTNIALNGTEIMLTGYLLGLPSLYDTEKGISQAGIFGLMDQGSNNGGGLMPVTPSAFERIYLGIETPEDILSGGNHVIESDRIYRLPVTSTEYFLIEYRKNTGPAVDSLYSAVDHLLSYRDVLDYLDSLSLVDYTEENGVITSLSNYDVSLPGAGLLIWHVNEASLSGENPNALDSPFLNLVEADGGDDIGKYYSTFDTRIMQGWKWDMWFIDNPAYLDNNPSDYYVHWNDETHPDSRSFQGAATGLAISRFRHDSSGVSIDVQISGSGSVDENTVWYSGVPGEYTLYGSRDSVLIKKPADAAADTLAVLNAAINAGESNFFSLSDSRFVFMENQDDAAYIRIMAADGSLLLENRPDHEICPAAALSDGALLYIPPCDPADPVLVCTVSDAAPAFSEADMSADSVLSLFFDASGQLAASSAPETFLFNGYELSVQEDGGYIYRDTLYAENILISSLIVLDPKDSDDACFAVLGSFHERPVLAALTRSGVFADHFPIFRDYGALRAYSLNDEVKLAAYDSLGRLDIIEMNGSIITSLPAPGNASHIFMEQISADTALIAMDGTHYFLESDSLLWAYKGKTAFNLKNTDLTIPSAIVSDEKLIRNDYIYNYPNPIHDGETRFRFYAQSDLSIEIKIFYLSGRYTGVTLEKDVSGGQWAEILWNTGDLQSGVYLAKVTATGGGNSETHIIKPAILK